MNKTKSLEFNANGKIRGFGIPHSFDFRESADKELLTLTKIGGGADSQVDIANGNSTLAPTIRVQGDGGDNIDFAIDAKGTGDLLLQAVATGNVVIGQSDPSGTNQFGSGQLLIADGFTIMPRMKQFSRLHSPLRVLRGWDYFV